MELGRTATVALRAGVCAVGAGVALAILASGRRHPPPPPEGPDPCGIDSLLARLTPAEREAARRLTQLTADPWRDPSAGTVEAAVQNVHDGVVSRSQVCQIVSKTAVCARLRRPGSTLAAELARAAVRGCASP